MVWSSQDASDDVTPGIDSVKAKPLKKRCGSRAGLSRYYSSKSQSFSSLDLVQCTPFGPSALALAKRPSSFDLRRGSTASAHGRPPTAGRQLSKRSSGDTSHLASMAMTHEEDEDADSSTNRCPCNDTIFADPSDALVSPDGSPSASPLQLYDSCSLASASTGAELDRHLHPCYQDQHQQHLPAYHQQQQLVLTSVYLGQLAGALGPCHQSGGCAGSRCCAGATPAGRSCSSSSCCSFGHGVSSTASACPSASVSTSSGLRTGESGSLHGGGCSWQHQHQLAKPEPLPAAYHSQLGALSSCALGNGGEDDSAAGHCWHHAGGTCRADGMRLEGCGVGGMGSCAVGDVTGGPYPIAGSLLGLPAAAPYSLSCRDSRIRNCVSTGGCLAAGLTESAFAAYKHQQHQQQLPQQHGAGAAIDAGWTLMSAAGGSQCPAAAPGLRRSVLSGMRNRPRLSSAVTAGAVAGRGQQPQWGSTEDLIASLSLSDKHLRHHQHQKAGGACRRAAARLHEASSGATAAGSAPAVGIAAGSLCAGAPASPPPTKQVQAQPQHSLYHNNQCQQHQQPGLPCGSAPVPCGASAAVLGHYPSISSDMAAATAPVCSSWGTAAVVSRAGSVACPGAGAAAAGDAGFCSRTQWGAYVALQMQQHQQQLPWSYGSAPSYTSRGLLAGGL